MIDLKTDVLIIGGGVIGCSIAYFLSQSGLKVTLVERDTVGAHASSASAGILGAQFTFPVAYPNQEHLSFLLQGRSMFPRLSEELLEQTGIHIQYRMNGFIKAAMTEESYHLYQEEFQKQKEQKLEVEWLERDELREREPYVSDTCLGGLFFPEEGNVSPVELNQALARGAEIHGAQLIPYCEVYRFETHKNHILKVITSHGEVSPCEVILCTGAWSRFVAQPLSISLPVIPSKGEAILVRMRRDQEIQHMIDGEDVYLVPKANRLLYIGSTTKDGEWDKEVSTHSIVHLLTAATMLVPSIKKAEWVKAMTSFRPKSKDKKPIISRTQKYGNLLIATGHGVNGILLGPWTGKIVANHLLKKESLPELFSLYR